MSSQHNPGDLALAIRLDRIEQKQDVLLTALVELKVQVEVLKTKAAIWGGIAGLAVGAVISKLLGA